MRKLIVNADDFGLHESINSAIVKAHKIGLVKSTTVIACGKAFDDAIALCRSCPKLGIGVHLSLVGSLKPLSSGGIDSLLDDNGVFLPDYKAFAKRYLLGKISVKQVKQELLLQMQKVYDSKVKITHIDSHQHLHVLPFVAQIVREVALEFGVARVRLPQENILFAKDKGDMARIVARGVLSQCTMLARDGYLSSGFKSSDYFFGMLFGGRLTEDRLMFILRGLPDDAISEIMCHPGSDNSLLGKSFGWDYAWQEELFALTSDEVLRFVHKSDIQLINFGDIL